MCPGLMFPLRSRIATFLLVAFSCGQTTQAAEWPTEKFLLVDANPNSSIPLSLNPTTGFDGDTAFIFAVLEAYMSDAAAYYSNMGFAAPSLELVDGRNGGQAYVVYVNDYSDKATHARYEANQMYLEIDLSRALKDGKATDETIEALAHELFHAIQRTYQTVPDTWHGDWITEGQAQAMGMQAARDLRGVDVYQYKQDDYRLGGREYFLPLPTETHDDTYRTASFWRYLGESGTSSGQRQSGAGAADPDYRYLVMLLENPFDGPSGKTADLLWLDEGLREATGQGLAHHYAHFAATFAGYVPSRLTQPPNEPEAAHDKWLGRLYGECPTGSLTDRSPVGSVRARLQPIAARCFKARFDMDGAATAAQDNSGAGVLSRIRSRRGGNNIDLLVQANASSISELEALWVGLSGGDEVSLPDISVAGEGGGYVGTWGFQITKGETPVFVISNVAKVPTTTEEQDLQLTLMTDSATMTSSSAGFGALVGGSVELRFDRFNMKDIMSARMETQQKAGIERPCMIRLAMSNSVNHAAIHLQMDNDGPVHPGTFNVIDSAKPETVAGQFVGGFGFGRGSEQVSYRAEGGSVEFTAISENVLQGKVNLLGQLPKQVYGQESSPWPETMNVQAEFTIVPRVNLGSLGSGKLKENFCFEPKSDS